MNTIKNLYHINSNLNKVLETIKDFKTWWCDDTTVNGKHQILKFGDMAEMDFELIEESDTNISWKCVANTNPAWLNTILSFSLDRNEDKTRVRFSHSNWSEEGDAYASTTFGWHRYLISLRELCETGKGSPFSI